MSDDDALDALDAQEGQQRKRQTKAQQQAERVLNDWRWLLSDERGRRLVKGLIDQCGTFGVGVTGTQADYYRTGQRDIGVGIFNAVMQVAPEAYLKMTKEQNDG